MSISDEKLMRIAEGACTYKPRKRTSDSDPVIAANPVSLRPLARCGRFLQVLGRPDSKGPVRCRASNKLDCGWGTLGNTSEKLPEFSDKVRCMLKGGEVEAEDAEGDGGRVPVSCRIRSIIMLGVISTSGIAFVVATKFSSSLMRVTPCSSENARKMDSIARAGIALVPVGTMFSP